MLLSKRANGLDGWWLSPEGTLHHVGFGNHASFITKHREIFGKVKGWDPYENAYQKDWVRIEFSFGNLFFETPNPFSDRHLKRAQQILDKVPAANKIIIYPINSAYDQIVTTYSIFAASNNIRDLIKHSPLQTEANEIKPISKFATIMAWWINPKGELYPTTNHKEFVFKHPEFFEISALPPYERAFAKGWVRVACNPYLLFFQIPSFNDRYLRTIKDALTELPTHIKNVRISLSDDSMGEYITLPYDELIEAQSFDELRQNMTKEAGMIPMSKQAETIYGYWVSPQGEMYPVETFQGHHDFVIEHPELFGHSGIVGTHALAYSKGWVRIVLAYKEINISVPNNDKKYFGIIQSILPLLPKRDQIIIAFKNNNDFIITTYFDLIDSHSFNELKKNMAKEAKPISSRDVELYGVPEAIRNPPQNITTPYVVQMDSDGSLKEYEKKRDFDKTKEPEGKEESGKNKHRYVIQEHSATNLHWDLRLENDEGSMTSWAIPKHRLPHKGEKLLAQKTENHPIEYVNFSGKIEEGYGKGRVKIHSKGKYELIEWTKDTIKFKIPEGNFILRHMDGKRWIIMVSAEK